jgi:hypothetical protein
MQPHLALQPDSGAVGSNVTVERCGFGEREEVQIYWNSPRVLPGKVQTDLRAALRERRLFSLRFLQPRRTETTACLEPA